MERMTDQDTTPTDPLAEASGCACSSRRTVLRGSMAAAAGAGALALSGCTAQLKEENSAQKHHNGGDFTEVLSAADLPVGESLQVEVDGRILLLHRQGEAEVTAYSNVCTHQGCAVEITERDGETTFGCPCHGSHFDPVTGRPYGGPAKKPLTDFEARVQGEQVQVKL